MKILFHDYSNELSTEPMYLFEALSQCGINPMIWRDPRQSAFDVFDMAKPDVFITHAQTITADIVKYLSASPKIDLVINVTGMSETQLKSVEDFITEKKISVPLLISNHLTYKPKPKTSLNLHRLLPACDIFYRLPKPPELSGGPMCKEAIISNEYCAELEKFLIDERTRSESMETFRQYHLVQMTSGDKSEHFDIKTNLRSVHTLFHMYETICIAGSSDFCLSQLFFDTVLNAQEMSVIAHDKDNFYSGLQELFTESEINTDDRAAIKEEMKKQVKQRHTPFHRAATLLKLLKDKESMMKVEKFKELLPNALKDI